MGLFGLFASIVGLGAMTKDKIDNNIFTQQSYNKAKAIGKRWYSGYGSKMYHTETGEECHMSFRDGHALLINSGTHQIIEDLTLLDNKEREKFEKQNCSDDCVFYRKCDWDIGNGLHCNIWVSDVISGYFYKSTVGKTMFYKGELVDCKWNNKPTKKVKYCYTDDTAYYPNGTKLIH